MFHQPRNKQSQRDLLSLFILRSGIFPLSAFSFFSLFFLHFSPFYFLFFIFFVSKETVHEAAKFIEHSRNRKRKREREISYFREINQPFLPAITLYTQFNPFLAGLLWISGGNVIPGDVLAFIAISLPAAES